MSALLLGLAFAGTNENPWTLDPSRDAPCELTLSAPFEEGYAAGRRDAQDFSMLKPGALSAGAGMVVAGTATFSCGVCGAPLAAAGCVVPPVMSSRSPPSPEAGPWELREADFREGYVAGYQEVGGRRQTKAALIGGAAGTVVGVTGATVALYVIRVVFFPDNDLLEL
ncbi:MAG: hypothetical protein GY913_26700 [Proteobacteria bacterium]|nr:hypothetical protein [Pseudomonadota bacterium]MCP4920506.1 hypothetical protein [Pseudomonadota bacterium]